MPTGAHRGQNALDWGGTLSAPPIVSTRIGRASPVSVRRWRGVRPVIEQPSLNDHYISLHLGGPKRVRRWGEGGPGCADLDGLAFSVVPAGAAFRWETDGPIDFAHVYLDPRAIDHVISSDFDRDPRRVSIQDVLGEQDPLLETLFQSVLELAASPAEDDTLYADELLQLLVHQLLRRYSTARSSTVRSKLALAPYRLRRALDFIDAQLGEPIGLAEVAAVTGVSPFHFSRAFRQATGDSPYAYVLKQRIERARRLLTGSDLSLTAIATDCGFGSQSQFSRTFKRILGTSPGQYRSRH
jgi:AraC family transcriptional regulator